MIPRLRIWIREKNAPILNTGMKYYDSNNCILYSKTAASGNKVRDLWAPGL
jgi:hypothetical protein